MEGRAVVGDEVKGVMEMLSAEDASSLVLNLVLWNCSEIEDQCGSGANVFVSSADVPKNAKEYFEKIVGMLPSKLVPNSARLMAKYVKYELDKKQDTPRDYEPLAKRKKCENRC